MLFEGLVSSSLQQLILLLLFVPNTSSLMSSFHIPLCIPFEDLELLSVVFSFKIVQEPMYVLGVVSVLLSENFWDFFA